MWAIPRILIDIYMVSYSSWPPLHLCIRVTGKMKPLIYIMGLSNGAQLQQTWSTLCDELDVLDDHTQITSRAGVRTRRTTRINMKYRIYSNKHPGVQLE